MSGPTGGSANGTAKNAAANAANNGVNNGANNGADGALNGAGIVRNADITQEMQVAYLDYAMSVIVARALPDVRDGLKPVHRRILYAMWHDLSLTYDKPHKKSARIVGEVLGKYHPHGDAAVYDAMVRMAQDFSLRYPLIDGQGNFGSIDGDNAAAMRYTEARLARITNLMLEDLEKDTVGWHPNFDNTLREPDILPAALPNLLINGSSGIAVGMATNIPPHNLGEVVDALVFLIDRFDQVEEITTEQLMQFIKGPDFPTGGIIYRFREEGKGEDDADAIAQGYSLGKSRLVVQAKAHFEEISRGRTRIIVTELPYQTNKTALLERIADLVRDGKIEGISDLRDESDRTGMRIVVELSRTIEPKDVLASLYKYTPLQQTFGMQLLALVDGQPRLLSLKRMLQLFVQHRQEIIRRRSEYDLKQARDRAHIVEGLLRALDILDEVIHTIRHSQTVDTARKNLIANFQFTEPQAQAILDMQLRRLAALERKKLQEEYAELKKRIAYLEDLLAHPHKILVVIKDELLAIRQEYADARRTQIVDRTRGALTTHDLLPDQMVWVSVSKSGDVRRVPAINRTGIAALRQVGKDSQLALLTANTRDLLYVFTRDGRCGRIDVHHLPADDTSRSIADLTGFRGNGVAAVAAMQRGRSGPEAGYFFFVTEKGAVKRVSVADVQANTATEFSIFNVEDGDKLGWALHTTGDREVILVSAEGQSIRFGEDEVRSMGLPAGGVGGMKLRPKDRIVYAGMVDAEGELVTVSATGYAKRTLLSEYSSQGRNGGGILAHKLVERTGRLEAGLVLPPRAERDTVILVSNKGVAKPLPVSEISRMGRSASGKQLITLAEKDVVTAAWLIASGGPNSPDEDDGGDGGSAKSEGKRKAKEAAPRKSTKSDVPAEQVELLEEVVERAQAQPAHMDAPRAAKTAPVAAAPLPLTRAPASATEKAKPAAAKQAEPVAKQAEAVKGPKQAPAEPQAAAPTVEAPKGKAKAPAEQAAPTVKPAEAKQPEAKQAEAKQPEAKQAAAKQAEAKPAVKQAEPAAKQAQSKAAKVTDAPAAAKAEPKAEPKSTPKAEAKPAAEPGKGKAQAKPVDVPVAPVKAAEPADAKAKLKAEKAEKPATPASVEAKGKEAAPAPAKKQEPAAATKPQPSEAKPTKAEAQKPESVKIEPAKAKPEAKPTPAEIAAGSRGKAAPKTVPGTVTIPFEFAQEKEPAKGAKPKAGAGKLDAVVSVTKSQAKKKKDE